MGIETITGAICFYTIFSPEECYIKWKLFVEEEVKEEWRKSHADYYSFEREDDSYLLKKKPKDLYYVNCVVSDYEWTTADLHDELEKFIKSIIAPNAYTVIETECSEGSKWSVFISSEEITQINFVECVHGKPLDEFVKEKGFI